MWMWISVEVRSGHLSPWNSNYRWTVSHQMWVLGSWVFWKSRMWCLIFFVYLSDFCVYECFFLHVFLCTIYMPGAHESQKRVLDLCGTQDTIVWHHGNARHIPRSSGMVTSALNHCSISRPNFFSFCWHSSVTIRPNQRNTASVEKDKTNDWGVEE